jgi:hypothetical protein
MKLGRLPRGLAVAAIAAVTVVPLAASPAMAAPAAPSAYAMFGSAKPLVWGSSSSTVGSLHVPFVWGKTNNVGVAKSEAKLADPNESLKPLSGDEIAGLTCPAGFDEKFCRDPFKPMAQVEHAGPDAGHSEMAASWPGKDGKYPGSIRAVTDCGGNCGPQLVHSLTSATGPVGALTGYVSVGSSSASHDLTMDDKGRLVSNAQSQLDNVRIGAIDTDGHSPVEFSKMVTTVQAVGAGAENSKDGRADIRISDFRILGYSVELTRAGLRLANGGPSEQEAYDGAKALVKRLKNEKGITLEVPNFDTQLTKSPAHVAVDALGLRITFQQGVGTVDASSLTYPLELGHATAVVAALDAPGRTMNVNENGGGVPTVENTQAAPPTSTNGTASPPQAGRGNQSPVKPPSGTGGRELPVQKPGTIEPSPAPAAGTSQPATPSTEASTPAPTDGTSAQLGATNPDENALRLRDVERKLGLRGARSVSRAFGAFLGLGLILPLARFVIRRLG